MEGGLVIPKPFKINIKPPGRDCSALAHQAARARLVNKLTGPRNTIKTAKALVKVERHKEALEHLCNYLEKRRILDGWEKDLQHLMITLLEGCVEMQNAWKARRALARYRCICVAGNASVDPVIEYFLEACRIKADAGLKDLKRQGLELNLENLGANFDQFTRQDHLALFQGHHRNPATKSRATSWFAFAWEVHRLLLDVFKNHSAFESAYNITVQRVLNFCLTYRRVDEFYDICSIIRYHLKILVDSSPHRLRILSLKDVRTAHNYLTTRLVQLRIAVELEQWQEAFRTIEDIHFLARAAQLPLSLGMMRNYYAQLSKIFKAVDSDLYHAISLYLRFLFEKRSMSSSELGPRASAVLLAALSVPLYADNGERKYEYTVRNDSILIGATRQMLSREGLLSALLSQDILAHVPPQVRKLFHLLEATYAIECYPADLAAEARSLLSTLHPQLINDYGSKLRKLIVLRVLKKASATYHILKFEDLHSMVPFLTLSEVKHLLIEASQHGILDNEVEWIARRGVIHFKGHGIESNDHALRNRLLRQARARELIHSTAQPTKIRRVMDFPSYTEKPFHGHDSEIHTGRWRDGSRGEYFAEQQEEEEEEEPDLTTSTSSTNSSAEDDADTWHFHRRECAPVYTWHHIPRERRRSLDRWRHSGTESDDSWRSRNAQVASVSSAEAETVESGTAVDAPRGRAASSEDVVDRDLCSHCRWHRDQGW